MRLLIARHGATQFNQEYRMTGQTDAPLSALGLRQAAALAERLAGERFDTVVSSDLARARQTAEPVAQRLGLPVTLDAGLREISMGDWEGRRYPDIVREHAALLQRIETDPDGATGAPGGETWAQFAMRIDGALAHWRARHPAGSVLWVTHGGVVSVLLMRALGLGLDRRWQFPRGNTSLFELDYTPRGVILIRVNDTSHLDRSMSDDEGERAQAL